MPVDERFSKRAFVEENARDPASRSLAEALEAAVQEELHAVIMPKLLELIDRLNGMGHTLREYTPPLPGDVNFRDQEKEGDCLLRVGVDTVISIGFKDTVLAESEGDASPTT